MTFGYMAAEILRRYVSRAGRPKRIGSSVSGGRHFAPFKIADFPKADLAIAECRIRLFIVDRECRADWIVDGHAIAGLQ